MQNRLLPVAFTLAALLIAGSAQAQEAVIAKTSLKVGDAAPEFSLLDNHWNPVKLTDYRGKKNVILAFYVLAFTGG